VIPVERRLVVVGAEEVAERGEGITHMVSIGNPGSSSSKPAGFRGEHLQLRFGDVVSEADARAWGTKAPTTGDIGRGLEFVRAAWNSAESRVLVHCDYGASRSPALAYVFAADHLGPGREAEAFDLILRIRPDAVPNRLVVRLGDDLLGRDGALLGPLLRLYRRLDEELSG